MDNCVKIINELDAESDSDIEEIEMMSMEGSDLEHELDYELAMGLELELDGEMDMELDSHAALRYHFKVWQLTGLIWPENMSRWTFFWRTIMINVLVTLFFPLTLMAKLFYTQSLRELCESLTITITDFAANFKFINVFFVRRQLHEIRRLLLYLDRRALLVQHPEELHVLHAAVRAAQNSFRIFAGLFGIGTMLSCLRTVITKHRMLIYPAYFGLDWQESDMAYVVICVYQLFGLIIQAIQDCANDSYPPAYLCVVTGHMRALELRIRRIGFPDVASDMVSFMYYQRWRLAVYAELDECIEDYIHILKMQAIIQEILSIACLAQIVCSAAVQCTVGIQFLYMADSHDLSAMAISIVFFVAVTLEVLIICYFGDRMRSQSEMLREAFYACNWIDQLPQFKRNLIISLMRGQRSNCIYAGGQIAVTLETFVQICRITYSAFTLLLRAK